MLSANRRAMHQAQIYTEKCPAVYGVQSMTIVLCLVCYLSSYSGLTRVWGNWSFGFKTLIPTCGENRKENTTSMWREKPRPIQQLHFWEIRGQSWNCIVLPTSVGMDSFQLFILLSWKYLRRRSYPSQILAYSHITSIPQVPKSQKSVGTGLIPQRALYLLSVVAGWWNGNFMWV